MKRLKSAFYMRIFCSLVICRRGLKQPAHFLRLKKILGRTGLRNIQFLSRKDNGFKDKCKCRERCSILCKFPEDVRTKNSQPRRPADSGDPGKGLGSSGRRHRRTAATLELGDDSPCPLPPLLRGFFFFLNDRLKCFCPYQKSLFLRRIVSKNKKTNGFLNWLLKGYPVPCRYNCVTFVERKDKVNCCLVAEIKCLIITGLWLLVREIFQEVIYGQTVHYSLGGNWLVFIDHL